MKLGFQVVLYVLCLNLGFGLVSELQIGGSSDSNPVIGTGDPAEYADRFDPDRLANGTQTNFLTDVSTYASIISGLLLAVKTVSWLLTGFPAFLFSLGGAINDPSARLAYDAVCGVILAILNFVVFFWLYQLLTGREVQN